MPLGPADIVLGYTSMTRAASSSPPWRLTSATFEERCSAASAGGFAGIGILMSAYERARAAGLSDADMRSMLSEHRLVVAELEGEGLALCGPRGRNALTRELESVLQVADLFGVERIFLRGAPGYSTAEMSETLAAVGDRCASHGVIAALEFMDIPSLSGVPDVASAVDIVRGAERANCGVLIDVYHHVHGQGVNDWPSLEAVPGQLVAAVQISDSVVPRVVDDYLEATMFHRRAPGEGDVDLVRFVRVLDAIGAACPYSVELHPEEIAALPPVALGERLGTATRQVLAAARSHTV